MGIMGYFIAYAVENVLPVLPTAGLTIASCIAVRRHRDHARSAFLWLRIALVFYLAFGSLFISFAVRRLALNASDTDTERRQLIPTNLLFVVEIPKDLQTPSDVYQDPRVSGWPWYSFLRVLAAAAISLTVLELGHGILFCAIRTSPRVIRMIRYILLAFGFVLTALSLGTGGALQQLRTDISNGVFDLPGKPVGSYVDMDAYEPRIHPLMILRVVIAVFCMLMSFTVAALSIWVSSIVRHSEKSDTFRQVRCRRRSPGSVYISLLTAAAFAPIGNHSPAHVRRLEFAGVDMGHPNCSVVSPRKIPLQLVVCSDRCDGQLDPLRCSSPNISYGAP